MTVQGILFVRTITTVMIKYLQKIFNLWFSKHIGCQNQLFMFYNDSVNTKIQSCELLRIFLMKIF